MRGRKAAKAGEPVVPEDLWVTLKALVSAGHHRDLDDVRTARRMLETSGSRRWKQFAHAVIFTGFVSMVRRIDHGPPYTDVDALERADIAFSSIATFSEVTLAEVLIAVRLALGLAPGPGFDPTNPSDAERCAGVLGLVVGVTIADMTEFDSMKADVGRWLISKGLAASP